MTSPVPALAPAKRRRLIAVALLRSLATAIVLVALYYLLPLDRIHSLPLGVLLAIGLVILLSVASWQVRSIISAKHPTVRAIGALATTVPVFLLLFAATYFLMAKTSPALLHGHHLQHRGIRRHLGGQRVRPAGGHRPDDPRPAAPGPGHPRVHRSRPARPPARAARLRRSWQPARTATTAKLSAELDDDLLAAEPLHAAGVRGMIALLVPGKHAMQPPASPHRWQIRIRGPAGL
jgi:hypothetical protein